MKIAVSAALLAVLSSCCSRGPCIKPPPMESSEQNTVAANIAAQLAGAPAGGSLSISYSNIIKESYDKLSDNDKALFLFLTALQCYLHEGQVGAEIARTLAEGVRQKWLTKDNAIPTARKIIRPELTAKINAIYKELGVKP